MIGFDDDNPTIPFFPVLITSLPNSQYWDTILYAFIQNSRYSNLYNILEPELMDLDSYREFIEQTHVSVRSDGQCEC